MQSLLILIKTMKFVHKGKVRYSKVHFFCNLPLDTRLHPEIQQVAIITLFSTLDPAHLQDSYDVFCICRKGNPSQIEDVVVVDVRSIQSVMAIAPAVVLGQDMWYVGYKPSASIAKIVRQPVEDKDNNKEDGK
jgi:hypothetical protein